MQEGTPHASVSPVFLISGVISVGKEDHIMIRTDDVMSKRGLLMPQYHLFAFLIHLGSVWIMDCRWMKMKMS